jgi:hypothetical protein
VHRIGVSTYFPEQVILLLKDTNLQHIQLPSNLLDPAWRTAEFSAAVAARPDVTIHVRSCLLQVEIRQQRYH